MNEYDDTNRGVAFPPFEDQGLILQGKLNVNGQDNKIVLIKDKTRNGNKIIEVYEKVAVLFLPDGRRPQTVKTSCP